MFKRAIITDEVSQDPAEAIRLAERFGLHGIEIRSVWDRRPHELSREQIRTLRGMAGDARLAVCGVATPVFKCALGDRDAVREHDEMLRRCLDLCGELGAPLARIFTFWRPGAPGAPADAGLERPWTEALSPIADRIAHAAEIAERFDVTLAVENEPSVYASTCARVAELLRRVQHRLLAAVWDPGNALYGPEPEPPYPDGYETLKPYLAHVHVKDARRDAAGGPAVAVVLGDGDVPYRDIFRRLLDDGYERFVALETHYRAAGPLSAEAARLPGGGDFSVGGLEASMLCLERWQAMLVDLGVAVPERRRR
ncbi:MAG: sugar phosphate isomerase/epimerase family protein [Armatimonadota bacterium]|nr:sugar phosphate isomerase/epimerase family protein [Armatimonadota bacterium]